MAAMDTTQGARYGIQCHWPRALRGSTAVAHTAHWPVIGFEWLGLVVWHHLRIPMACNVVGLVGQTAGARQYIGVGWTPGMAGFGTMHTSG
jgi:hypothetical protein